MFGENRFEDLLKSLRVRRGKAWTQAKTAQALGVSLRTYVGWENGESLPSQRDLKQIAAAFQLNDTESDMLFHAAGQAAPVIHNLPFSRNPFFTGRQTLLKDLDRLFEKNESIALTQPISVSGLGGIGKTQIALEYAHCCHPDVYRSVLWVNAADKATLEASYLSLAHLLQLPEENAREVDRIVQAVKIWLEKHSRWLLILDNADDLELARSFLPTKPGGRILLTTRSQIVGNLAALIQVEAMPPEEGLLFLLRRSGVLKSGAEPQTIASDIYRAAEQLVEILGGHPLALDQAGAYIEETRDPCVEATDVAFGDYIQLYQEQQRFLLNRRGSLGGEHPQTVTVTFEISFQKACQLYPACADVLSFCAFLHPDAIPEELLSQETSLNLRLLMLNEVMRALRKYSLIKRDVEKKHLSVHRLVQAVIRAGMDRETLRQWTERVVRALNAAFPEVTFEQWARCARLLPHALACAAWIEREPLSTLAAMTQADAARLLNKTGSYLKVRARYKEAEPLYRRALAIREQLWGTEHPETASSLNNLADLYQRRGKYTLAVSLYQRALAIREQHLGAEHPDTAISLNNLANLYWRQGKSHLAEPLYLRALSIIEQRLGSEHPQIAETLTGLANLYWHRGEYGLAEPLYQRALAIREQHLGAEHPDTAVSLNNLADLYWRQGKYDLAEPLYQRALAIREQHLGTEHPDTAMSINDLGLLYRHQGKYDLAEPLLRRALAIFEQQLGADHPVTAGSLNGLANLYLLQGKYDLAEPLYLRALAIREQHLGAEFSDTATSLNNLAELYQRQGKYEQAEAFYKRALSSFERHLGTEHPVTSHPLHGLAETYQRQGKYEQAEAFYKRALAIRAERLGPTHPETQETREAYAALLHLVGRDEEAEALETDHASSAGENNN